MQKDGFDKSYWESHCPSWGNNALAPLCGQRGSAFIQYKAMKRCYELIAEHEMEHRGGQKYDFIVTIRSDHWCTAPPFCLSDLTNKTAVIPDGEDYNGLNDRMSALPRSAAEHYHTGAWNRLIKNSHRHEFMKNTESLTHILVNETGLLLQRTPMTCFVNCMKRLTPSNWGQCSSQLGSPWYGFKYQSERNAAILNQHRSCNNTHSTSIA
eukprot:CCRYP_011978-RA/>CCRYP_011978-RA protein AED:0.07 eAED:0.07 QI:334/1/1/1/0/0/3/43/209